MKTVYLVEDAPLVRERLLELLGDVPGIRVVGVAARAGEAIAEILAERPDVVVLDLHLAEGSGFDVLRKVHAAAPEIAVYILSSFATQAYRRRAVQLGASDFFDKNTEFARVREVVSSHAALRH